jgi:hypothetical protein
MSIKCPQCAHDNPPDSAFCEECGFKLPTAQPAVAPSPPSPPKPMGLCALTFKNGAFEVSEPIKTFGRQDFAKHLSESEYKFVSRKQFTIFNESGKFFIQDGGEEQGKWKESSNGTRLNGEDLRGLGKKELKDNDKISVADTIELQFNIRK